MAGEALRPADRVGGAADRGGAGRAAREPVERVDRLCGRVGSRHRDVVDGAEEVTRDQPADDSAGVLGLCAVAGQDGDQRADADALGGGRQRGVDDRGGAHRDEAVAGLAGAPGGYAQPPADAVDACVAAHDEVVVVGRVDGRAADDLAQQAAVDAGPGVELGTGASDSRAGAPKSPTT